MKSGRPGASSSAPAQLYCCDLGAADATAALMSPAAVYEPAPAYAAATAFAGGGRPRGMRRQI
jgi:hypothetical protein